MTDLNRPQADYDGVRAFERDTPDSILMLGTGLCLLLPLIAVSIAIRLDVRSMAIPVIQLLAIGATAVAVWRNVGVRRVVRKCFREIVTIHMLAVLISILFSIKVPRSSPMTVVTAAAETLYWLQSFLFPLALFAWVIAPLLFLSECAAEEIFRRGSRCLLLLALLGGAEVLVLMAGDQLILEWQTSPETVVGATAGLGLAALALCLAMVLRPSTGHWRKDCVVTNAANATRDADPMARRPERDLQAE